MNKNTNISLFCPFAAKVNGQEDEHIVFHPLAFD